MIAWVVNSRLHPRRASLFSSASSFSILSSFCFLHSAFCFALFAPCYPLCFQANVNCLFWNRFVLITNQVAGGGVAGSLRYGPGAWLTKQTGRIPDTVS